MGRGVPPGPRQNYRNAGFTIQKTLSPIMNELLVNNFAMIHDTGVRICRKQTLLTSMVNLPLN